MRHHLTAAAGRNLEPYPIPASVIFARRQLVHPIDRCIAQNGTLSGQMRLEVKSGKANEIVCAAEDLRCAGVIRLKIRHACTIGLILDRDGASAWRTHECRGKAQGLEYQ